MEEKKREALSKHIAGIVPVSNMETDVDLLIPTALLPLDNNFYSIQRSILECAYAGCQTIWVVCRDDIGPLIKKVLGDFVVDPQSVANTKYKKYPSEHIKHIPIFYVPISYKNQNKKGFAISVLEGITSAFVVSDKMSKWLIPHRYYVSSPYGVYDPKVASTIRRDIKSCESVFLTCAGQSVLEGLHLGFSISSRQFRHCNYLFKRLSPKDTFTLDKIFGVDKYDSIDSWSGYLDIFRKGLSFDVYPFWKNLFNKDLLKKGTNN